MTWRTTDPQRVQTISAALAAEYRMQAAAVQRGDVPLAWHHLGRAHILAQTRLGAHCVSHWKMLVFAVRLRNWPEAAGQLLRLALAPLGNLTGRLPLGNTGRSTVSAFAPMDIPLDLRAILDRTSN
ncbi:MAG: DUF3703 domain-containing protein [Blastomonas sp.]|uniref:DUF3703 domain-containing protein n=1 Tax=unclassified Blastomonas TaxID=2626550 RepID=UPI0006B98FE2|nr:MULTISPECIES: DUF3703 domain-containing protein [unclassified Blastomonas]KPF72331.1 hypothetical protein IP68_17720 [Blastomonas sp. AAP25]MCO5795086.1 DUF3703 domain-containing protein [Blastomonas sp.]